MYGSQWEARSTQFIKSWGFFTASHVTIYVSTTSHMRTQTQNYHSFVAVGVATGAEDS